MVRGVSRWHAWSVSFNQGVAGWRPARPTEARRPTLRWITESYYNKKRKEFRAKQKEISGKIASLGIADEEYYLTSEYLMQLANRAYDLFMSSEAEEKRQLLKLTLQNLILDGKKVEFELVKPFDKVFACASSQTWPLFDLFRHAEFAVGFDLSNLKGLLEKKRSTESSGKSGQFYRV